MCGDLLEGQMTGEILGTGALILVDRFSYPARRPDLGMKEKHKFIFIMITTTFWHVKSGGITARVILFLPV